ncbi:unnamed protein product [Clonostachys rosea]|uniref:Xylanolytic transcriptional activator regulatory domain-containing protein n=1 Tax=Bionectria ochroleuca TaxID=29856 RepID=A0ABY6TW93_BIOOC|nr:unnamed protein product [Clonostachys rosea]
MSNQKRSPALLGFEEPEQERRKHAWWCVYYLDRMLSMALGRPVAIRDMDCDVELEAEGCLDDAHMGFFTILSLRKIIGDILDTVSAVGTVKNSRTPSSELQNWVTAKVPESLKAAQEGNLKLERLLALSGYFSGLMLLYRYLMSNPHRSSPLKGTEAAMRCARAATNCIGISQQLLDSMPVCPDLIFHFQNVFTASMVLLHCIRRSEDHVFKESALKQVEIAIHALRRLQPIWPEVETMSRCLEEYLELILESLEKGASFRQCLFHHDAHELTGLEWRRETTEDAIDFPVWTDMDLASLFGSEMDIPILPVEPDSQSLSHDDVASHSSYNTRSAKSANYNQRSIPSAFGATSLDSRLQEMDQALWGYMMPGEH